MKNTLTPSQPASLQAAATGYSDRYGNAASPPSSNSLHSVRKPPAKPWKKPAAPPVPPKVYRVDPRGFRQLVQRLTGATEVVPRRLREAAPVPLDVAPRQHPVAPQQLLQQPAPVYLQGGASLPSSSSTAEQYARGLPAGEAPTAEPPQAVVAGYQPEAHSAGVPSPSLYSACLTWCNLPLLSPGSMAYLEQSTVL